MEPSLLAALLPLPSSSLPSPESSGCAATVAWPVIPGLYLLLIDSEPNSHLYPSRTACHWQALAADHDLMSTRFRAAMSKMSLLGHNRADLTDCSAIIPAAAAITTTGSIPPGLSAADIENSVSFVSWCEKVPSLTRLKSNSALLLLSLLSQLPRVLLSPASSLL